jgi:hypothetical protein
VIQIYIPSFIRLWWCGVLTVPLTFTQKKKKKLEIAATNPLHAANDYAKYIKDTHYQQDAASARNMGSIPLVAESTGGWCKTAIRFFKRLAREDDETSHLATPLCHPTQRSNSGMIKKRLPESEPLPLVTFAPASQ